MSLENRLTCTAQLSEGMGQKHQFWQWLQRNLLHSDMFREYSPTVHTTHCWREGNINHLCDA